MNLKNWWYYYKWYVIGGCVLAGIVIDLAGSGLGWFEKRPDIQIAYVGRAPLPDDTVQALETAFSSLASDYNGDGRTLVQVHQYTSGNPDSADSDAYYYQYAGEVTLIGDISDNESYFFLLEDPEDFQKTWQLLAMPDGSVPGTLDLSAKNKVFLWSDCPLLTDQELGSYTDTSLGQSISGTNQERLSGLYLGRRCFYNEEQTANAAKCAELWDTLKESASQDS